MANLNDYFKQWGLPEVPPIPVIPAEARRHLRTVEAALSRADGVLRTLWHAREGTAIDRVLAGASIVGQVLDMLVPDEAPEDTLHQLGYRAVQSGVTPLLLNLVESSATVKRETVTHHTSRGEDEVHLVFWTPVDGPERAVAAIHRGTTERDSDTLYVLGGDTAALRAVVREAAWTNGRDYKLEHGGRRETATILLLPAEPPGEYIADPPLEWYAARERAYAGYHRTIRFVGPSGVGKSTLARRLGREMLGPDARTLRVASTVTARLDHADLIDVADYLGPDVFVIDDLELALDHGNADSMSDVIREMPRELAFLEALHDRIPLTVLTLMRVREQDNSARVGLGSGMRPGRLDETYWIEVPTPAVRYQLVRSFIAVHFGDADAAALGVDEKVIKIIVDATEGLTGAYISEAVRRIRCLGVSNLKPELKKLVGEVERLLAIKVHRRRMQRRWGNAKLAVKRGAINPKARALDLRAYCQRRKLTPASPRKIDLVAAVEAHLNAKKAEPQT